MIHNLLITEFSIWIVSMCSIFCATLYIFNQLPYFDAIFWISISSATTGKNVVSIDDHLSELWEKQKRFFLWNTVYTPCLKNSLSGFYHNFVKFLPAWIIFGTKMSKTIELCKVHLFTTSPNLCQCTTMWNTDTPNCYITWLIIL